LATIGLIEFCKAASRPSLLIRYVKLFAGKIKNIVAYIVAYYCRPMPTVIGHRLHKLVIHTHRDSHPHTHTHSHTHTPTHTHTQTHTHTYTHKHTYTNTHRYTQVGKHRYTQVGKHRYTQVDKHRYT
jgi:hypothetical protein